MGPILVGIKECNITSMYASCVRDFVEKERVHEVWVGNLMTPESDSHRKKKTQNSLPWKTLRFPTKCRHAIKIWWIFSSHVSTEKDTELLFGIKSYPASYVGMILLNHC